MTDNNSHFIRAFEELKSEINRLAGKSESFEMQLDLAARKNSQVERRRSFLRYVRDVRNTLQHPRHKSSGAAIDINTHFLNEVQALLDALKNPPRAHNICVPRGRLFIAAPTDTVGTIVAEMQANKYSHVPILNNEGVLLGVFNEASIFDYYCSDDLIDARRDMPLELIMKHCRLDAGHTETFGFVQPTVALDDLVRQFTRVEDGVRIGALFVTPSGKADDPVVGMLTAWDVLKPMDQG